MQISAARLKAYRDRTYRRTPSGRVRSLRAALDFIEERGFVYFWPIKGVELPSLWTAAAGNRPVADNHDDPGHITWDWKDKLLAGRRVFYAKVLRGRATFISLSVLPWFYALSENYGSPAEDYLLQYEAGRMTLEAKSIYETLLNKGPLDTLSLRREARLGSRDTAARFERALVELQRDLKILPIGIAEAGTWRYAFVYELVDRWFPHLAAQARPLSRSTARAHLLDIYLQSVGAATEAQVEHLFRWRMSEVRVAADTLTTAGQAVRAATVAGEHGNWLVTPAIL